MSDGLIGGLPMARLVSSDALVGEDEYVRKIELLALLRSDETAEAVAAALSEWWVQAVVRNGTWDDAARAVLRVLAGG
jgi:hypothetical protein